MIKAVVQEKLQGAQRLHAQFLSLCEKVSFSSHPKAKVSSLCHPGASRVLP